MDYVFRILELQYIVRKLPSIISICAISISSVSIDIWFFSSQVTCQLLNFVCKLTCILLLCEFLHVKSEKLANTLSNIHIDAQLSKYNYIVVLQGGSGVLPFVRNILFERSTYISFDWLPSFFPLPFSVMDNIKNCAHLFYQCGLSFGVTCCYSV